MIGGATVLGHCIVNAEGARSVLDPEWVKDSKTIPDNSLNQSAARGLTKVRGICRDILETYPSDRGSTVAIAAMKQNDLCCTAGSKKSAVILFNPSALEDISGSINPIKSVYLTTWLGEVAKLPADPEKLQRAVEKKGETDLGSLMGLYHECAFCLDDDELYFILKHELSHQRHRDNEARVAVKLVAAAVTLIFMNVYCSSLDTGWLTLAALFSFILPNLLVVKLEHSQEHAADCSGIDSDARARRGALSYFKKMAIYELASDRYYRLTGKVFSVKGFAFERLNSLLGTGHPGALERYSNVFRNRSQP